MANATPFDNSDVGTILIRGVNWLGDAVMTTPAIGTIREYFPTARITLMANSLVAELFSPHPWVDDLIVLDKKGRHKGIGGRLRLAGELRERGFDLVILLPNSLDSALVPWLAGIPRRLGYGTDGRNLLLTHTVPRTVRKLDGHQSGYYLACINHFGIISGPKPQLLVTTAAEDAAIEARLAESGMGADDFLIAINPGATYGSAKRWYPERFAAVADELAVRWPARVVITGGPEEQTIANEIAQKMKAPCCILAGKTSVRELLAVIKRCNFLVTNDSGPMHVAAAFGTPQVAIFGSTDNRTTYPLSEQALVLRKEIDCAPCMKRVCPTDHRCMTAITVEDVVGAAELLKKRLHG